MGNKMRDLLDMCVRMLALFLCCTYTALSFGFVPTVLLLHIVGTIPSEGSHPLPCPIGGVNTLVWYSPIIGVIMYKISKWVGICVKKSTNEEV